MTYDAASIVPTAHVLLDLVTAYDDDLGESQRNIDAMQLAFARMQEVDAVRVSVTDDGDNVDVALDLTPLLGAAAVSMKWLVGHLAVVMGKDELEVIAMLREFHDSTHGQQPGT